MDRTLIKDSVKIDLEWLGEGNLGDYDGDDPIDTPLLRFTVYSKTDGEWDPCPDASYCTLLPRDITEDQADQALQYLMDRLYRPLTCGWSIKKLCEQLSWICPADLMPDN